MSDPAAYLGVTGLLLGIWGLLNAAQWIADLTQWRGGSALGWDLQRLRRGRIVQSRLIAAIFAPTGLAIVAAVQLLVSAVLIALPLAGAIPSAFLMGCFAAVTLTLALRAGPDGADKMALVVTSGALLQAIGIHCNEPRLTLAGVLWTGGQLTIAYFAAGASKLLLAPWRSGTALSAALSSYMWGHRWSAAVVRQHRLAWLLAWLIMLIEVAFPLALLAPTAWLVAVLAGFLLFHLAIAVTMGLNLYPGAFIAAYPSVLLLAQWLRGALGLG